MKRILSLALSLVILQVSVAHAAAADLPNVLTSRITLGNTPLGHIDARQDAGIPTVPAGCKTDCDPVNTVLATGPCSVAKCCAQSFFTGYFNCFECVANATQLTDLSVPQSFIDSLHNQCALKGISLPVLTFPGQPSNRPLSSVVPSTTQGATSTSNSMQVTITSDIAQPTSESTQVTIGPSSTQTDASAAPTTTSSASRAYDTWHGLRIMEVLGVMIVMAWVV